MTNDCEMAQAIRELDDEFPTVPSLSQWLADDDARRDAWKLALGPLFAMVFGVGVLMLMSLVGP